MILSKTVSLWLADLTLTMDERATFWYKMQPWKTVIQAQISKRSVNLLIYIFTSFCFSLFHSRTEAQNCWTLREDHLLMFSIHTRLGNTIFTVRADMVLDCWTYTRISTCGKAKDWVLIRRGVKWIFDSGKKEILRKKLKSLESIGTGRVCYEKG